MNNFHWNHDARLIKAPISLCGLLLSLQNRATQGDTLHQGVVLQALFIVSAEAIEIVSLPTLEKLGCESMQLMERQTRF